MEIMKMTVLTCCNTSQSPATLATQMTRRLVFVVLLLTSHSHIKPSTRALQTRKRPIETQDRIGSQSTKVMLFFLLESYFVDDKCCVIM